MPHARKRYVGLDVHKDVVEYCILDAAGKKIDGGRIICERTISVRFVPPLSEVYEKEGLPPTRSFDEFSVGEKRAIKEMGLTEHVRKTETVQVIVKPKKRMNPCAKVE